MSLLTLLSLFSECLRRHNLLKKSYVRDDLYRAVIYINAYKSTALHRRYSEARWTACERGSYKFFFKKCPSLMSVYLSYIKEINSQHWELPFHCSKGLCMVI